MNFILKFSLTLGLWLGLMATGQVSVRADDPPPPLDLTQILKVMPVGAGWDDVTAEANVECSGTGHPLYHSTQLESQSFEGDFTPDTDCKLAIFSDDGSDVTIDGNKVWSGKGTGQTLEKLDQSLHKMNVTLTANTTHHIRVDYANSWYDGNGDIDGVTLFVYDRPLDITFPSGLTNNTIRACAGAVPDSVHEQTVTIHAADGNNPASGQSLTVAFDNTVDYTGCKPPQLVDDQNNEALVSTLTRTTDSNGNTSVTVLSSDLISSSGATPNLIVSQNSNQIGSVPCDFGADQSIRRYGIKELDGNYASDTGWDLDDVSWLEEDDLFNAKLLLKFQKDPINVPIDTNYYLVNGQAVDTLDTNGDGELSLDEINAGIARGFANYPLTDAANWLPVCNHGIRLKIVEVDDVDGTKVTDPATIQNYLYYVNSTGSPIDSNGNPVADPDNFTMPETIPATTDSSGSAVLRLKAGPWIYFCNKVIFESIDITQVDSNGTTVDASGNF